MKKAKSIIAVLLVFSIVFLCGCSNISAILNKIESDYYEVTAISEEVSDYTAVEISGDNVLFLAYSGVDSHVLFVYDAKKNKVTAKSTLDDCGLETVTRAGFTNENEITVYDDVNEKAVSCDLTLNKIGDAKYEPEYFDSENAPESELFNNEFDRKQNYAVCYDMDKTTSVFYDDVNKCYINKNDNSIFIDECNKSIMKSSYVDDDKFFVVAVDNYEDGVKTNEIKFEAQADLIQNVLFGKINEEYAVFVLEISNDKTGGAQSIPYIWKYNEHPTNEKLDLTVKSTSDFAEENEKLIEDIKSTYDIKLAYGEETKDDCDSYPTEFDLTVLELNIMLTNLKDCLALLPNGFIKELYDYNDMITGLKINLVKNIDSVSAYVVDIFEEPYIVFSYFSLRDVPGVFFHELMHLIDDRLTDYYEKAYGYDFYDEWCKLNPDDFEYMQEKDRDPDFEHDTNYFVSSYATNNMVEDTADTLRYLCEKVDSEVVYAEGYGEDDVEEEKLGENVSKKIELLCKAIREAFPSTANAEELYWEKALDKLNK